MIVSGGVDGEVWVSETIDRRALGEPLRGHYSPVNAVALGQRGGCAVIVSGGFDRTVRVWDLESGAALGEPITRTWRCG